MLRLVSALLAILLAFPAQAQIIYDRSGNQATTVEGAQAQGGKGADGGAGAQGGAAAQGGKAAQNVAPASRPDKAPAIPQPQPQFNLSQEQQAFVAECNPDSDPRVMPACYCLMEGISKAMPLSEFNHIERQLKAGTMSEREGFGRLSQLNGAYKNFQSCYMTNMAIPAASAAAAAAPAPTQSAPPLQKK